MQRTKRQFSDNYHNFTDNKKKKKSIEVISTKTHFEDLSNDIIYEIFDYLDYFHIYQGFFNLNVRYHHLLTNSNLPIKINISSISKWSFYRFHKHIIKTNLYRIQSIRISNVCMYDYVFLTIPNLSKISGLKTLILDQIESKRLKNLLEQLRSSSSLSSLIISTIDRTANKTEICLQLFRLSTLKFCKLSFQEYWNIELQLPIAMISEQSSIEHLIMTDAIYIHQLDSLFSYLPHLRRLSLCLLQDNRQTRAKLSNFVLNDISDLSIHIDNVRFDIFAQIMIDLFPNIQALNFTQLNNYNADRTYLNANKWKQLITSQLKNLRIFNMQLDIRLETTDNQDQLLFTTPFWIEQEWFITHQLCSFHYGDCLSLYSIKRKKSYILCKSSDKNTTIQNDKLNLNSVRHIQIEDERGLLESMYRFPNANELTFRRAFSTSRTSLTTILNNILPLKQLTKLTIHCRRFSLKKIIELIHWTPYLHTLKFTSMLLYKDNHETIQKQNIFQSVSATNNITHVIYSDVCTLENLKLLIILCPRIQHLTINTYAQNLQTNVRFLLDKNNEHTRHLCSLNFTSASAIWTKRLDRLFRNESLIRNYTLKFVQPKLYLTW